VLLLDMLWYSNVARLVNSGPGWITGGVVAARVSEKVGHDRLLSGIKKASHMGRHSGDCVENYATAALFPMP
jgi:hypothetical protein